jgi:hypothetical protein
VGKNLPWLFVGIRAERQQSPRYPQLKAVLGMCFVQTLQMVKVNCSSEGQRGFYKCAAIGQSKFRRSRDPNCAAILCHAKLESNASMPLMARAKIRSTYYAQASLASNEFARSPDCDGHTMAKLFWRIENENNLAALIDDWGNSSSKTMDPSKLGTGPLPHLVRIEWMATIRKRTRARASCPRKARRREFSNIVLRQRPEGV